MKQFNWFLAGIFFLVTACSSPSNQQEVIEQKDMMGNAGKVKVPMGLWEAKLQLRPNYTLPFRFKVMQVKGGDPVLQLINGEEQIAVDEFEQVGDSVRIGMHIFNSEIIAKIGEKSMQGRWIRKDYDDYHIPFKANMVDKFTTKASPAASVSGKWATTFQGVEEGDADEMAVGIFNQEEDGSVTGTFLTTTGDYRYLSGKLDGKKLVLAAFDGAHSFLFEAMLNDQNELVEGVFLNGKHWMQKWTAKKDENAELPDLNTLTYLKEGYDKVEFTFPNLKGEPVSLSDEKYKGKVVVIQLFGSWCPNCMDETKFLAPFYDENKDKGFEIIGLAFERKPEFEKAVASVTRMKDRIGVNYDLLIAGVNDKAEAAKKLPMLNHVLAYPTTIFIDRKGEVRKIHTGFTGPGTGEYYVQLVEEFNLFVDKLLAEKTM